MEPGISAACIDSDRTDTPAVFYYCLGKSKVRHVVDLFKSTRYGHGLPRASSILSRGGGGESVELHLI